MRSKMSNIVKKIEKILTVIHLTIKIFLRSVKKILKRIYEKVCGFQKG